MIPKWPSHEVRFYVQGLRPGEAPAFTEEVRGLVVSALGELAPLLGLSVRQTREQANLVVKTAVRQVGCGWLLIPPHLQITGCADQLPAPVDDQYTAEVTIYKAREPDYYGAVLHELVHALAGMGHVERDSVISLYGRRLTDLDRGLLRLVGDGLIDRQGLTRAVVTEFALVDGSPAPTATPTSQRGKFLDALRRWHASRPVDYYTCVADRLEEQGVSLWPMPPGTQGSPLAAAAEHCAREFE